MAIALRYAARSDVGLVRQNNQDSAYAGPHLLVVADGMGGHAGGDVASSLAIGELAPLDDESHGADALERLRAGVMAAHRELLERVHEEPQLTGMGTTVTALLRTGGRLALAHIGDSRAYLLRDGELIQITRDHTFVQTLVDEGRLTQEEAEQHPQRSVLMRVLSDVVDDVEPDLSMREARIGDRYLLCSDGLSGVVSHDTLRDTLDAGSDPASTCEAFVALARRGGAPDNVTCIVADVVPAGSPTDSSPAVVGAATLRQQRRAPGPNGSAAERAAALTAPTLLEDGDDEASPAPAPHRPGRTARRLLGGLLVVAILAGGVYTAWRWVMRQYFVGAHDGSVAIFHGIPDDVGPVHLSSVDEVLNIPVTDLPQYSRERVRNGIWADTHAQALTIVSNLRDQAAACRAAPSDFNPTASASATTVPVNTTTVTATPSATAGAPVPAPTATVTTGATTSPSSPVTTVTSTATIAPTTAPTSPGAADCRGLNQ
ncbi:MAG TPA: PP2C family serine/threonine-protein phosphatase [Kineosporiaceae bacterium]|nr:PP2C family serine/threonine-protein phosphatase [Kineosporiaceae bacterium]